MIKTKETVTRTHEHEISNDCLLHMLAALLGKPVPLGAQISVVLPSDGDREGAWGDTSIKNCPIRVVWTTKETP